MNKKIVTLLTVGTVMFGSLVGPFAQNVFADDVDQKINETDQKLEDVAGQQSSAKEALTTIVDSIAANEEKIAAQLKTITESQQALEVLSREIETLNINIANREVQIDKQARAIQTSGGNQSYIDLVFSADSISDAFNKINAVSTIVGANQDMVAQQKADKESVEAKEAEATAKIEEQTKVMEEYKAAQAELDAQKIDKEAIVAQLAADQATLQADKDKYLAQKADAEKRAEEARAAAEQAAAVAVETPAVAPAVAPVAEVPATSTTDNGGGVTATEPPTVTQPSIPGSSGNAYAPGYCTWYAYDRRAALGRPVGSFWGNASQWASAAAAEGYTVVQGVPVVGAVMQNGGGWGGYGHVAVVESVNPDGSITVSEMNYQGLYIISSRTIPAGSLGAYTFIY